MSMLYHITNNVGQYGMVVLYWLVIQNFIQFVILKKLIKNMVPEFVAIIPSFTVWCKINKNTNDVIMDQWSLNFKYSVNKLIDFYFFHLQWWYIFLYGKYIFIVIIIIVIKLQKYVNITLVNAHKKEILCSSIIILIYANIHMS